MALRTLSKTNNNVKSLLVLQNFTIAQKSANIALAYCKLLSSDTRQSMKRRIATKR